MEQHPVPQNITGFQFKLIGDMTIKQFFYFAGGILAGYIVLQLGLSDPIGWFLALTMASSGFAFAFIPIEERPLDRWLISFFRCVYSPTQFLWKKRATPPEFLTKPAPERIIPNLEAFKKEVTTAKIEEYLMTLPRVPTFDGELEQKEKSFINKVLSSFGWTKPTHFAPELPTQEATIPLPGLDKKEGETEEAREPAVDLEQRTEELTNKILTFQQELTGETITRERFVKIQVQLSQLLKEKERLTNELVNLKKILAQKEGQQAIKPTVAAQAPEEPRVKIISPEVAPKLGMPRPPYIANIVSGMVKTQKGKILPGIIVEARNQEGTPVRALKTNRLGQFAVSTPLPSGIYTIHLEDPQKTFRFDIIELTLSGEIIAPLEIFAKTEKDKMKEELRKKLFNQDSF